MEDIYSIIFNIRYFQYCRGWHKIFILQPCRETSKNTAYPCFPSEWQQTQSFGNNWNTTQASWQQKYFYGASQMGCWAASCQGHPSGGHTTMQGEGFRATSAHVAGMKQKAIRYMGHTLQLSVTTYMLCSHHWRTSRFTAMTFFMSANKLQLQWQLKVTRLLISFSL